MQFIAPQFLGEGTPQNFKCAFENLAYYPTLSQNSVEFCSVVSRAKLDNKAPESIDGGGGKMTVLF